MMVAPLAYNASYYMYSTAVSPPNRPQKQVLGDVHAVASEHSLPSVFRRHTNMAMPYANEWGPKKCAAHSSLTRRRGTLQG